VSAATGELEKKKLCRTLEKATLLPYYTIIQLVTNWLGKYTLYVAGVRSAAKI